MVSANRRIESITAACGMLCRAFRTRFARIAPGLCAVLRRLSNPISSLHRSRPRPNPARLATMVQNSNGRFLPPYVIVFLALVAWQTGEGTSELAGRGNSAFLWRYADTLPGGCWWRNCSESVCIPSWTIRRWDGPPLLYLVIWSWRSPCGW